MALATNGGHIARALEFYNTEGKYFIVGGTQPWSDEAVPESPSVTDFKLRDVVALKKVDNAYLVIPNENGTIHYRSQNWKIVPARVETTLQSAITAGSTTIQVASVAGLTQGSKIRINNIYEATITNTPASSTLTLDTAAPVNIPNLAPVIGGALVEGAKYVYLECSLNYSEFPICTYRQIGLCTGVTPNTSDILKCASESLSGNDEWTNLGILEILDNRVPATRDPNQRELLSLIVEF